MAILTALSDTVVDVATINVVITATTTPRTKNRRRHLRETWGSKKSRDRVSGSGIGCYAGPYDNRVSGLGL